MVNYQFQRLSEIRQLAEITVITILPGRSVTPLFFQMKIFILLEKMLSLNYQTTGFPLLGGRSGS